MLLKSIYRNQRRLLTFLKPGTFRYHTRRTGKSIESKIKKTKGNYIFTCLNNTLIDKISITLTIQRARAPYLTESMHLFLLTTSHVIRLGSFEVDIGPQVFKGRFGAPKRVEKEGPLCQQ
jgi:hypothetical protein